MPAEKTTIAQPVAKRRLSVGAELQGGSVNGDAVSFRVWNPDCRQVEVVLPAQIRMETLAADGDGYFTALLCDVPAGTPYAFRLDGNRTLLPDPASRFQPEGPRGLSIVVDPKHYQWNDRAWQGVARKGNVLYEMHVGTFTCAGTWQAASEQLPALAELGVTIVELMPIAEFPGRFGWSYDPAGFFAPSHGYGEPDDFRTFVDAAHQAGLGVILDVVYNHMGSVGEALLRPFAASYVSTRHNSEWESAFNYDDEGAAGVRRFVLDNVRHWIEEYHLDGFRIDATQAFFDDSPRHILLEIAQTARQAAGERGILLVGESEPQRAELLRDEAEGGCELDALVNDDFHHAAMVAMTGRREAYYTDYTGAAEELGTPAARWGFLYQGQRYSWQKAPRGSPALDIAAHRFIHCLENHDQLANSLDGARAHQLTSPGRLRTLTALQLLAPQTPMLFQGQEFAATTPFLYFNDCEAGEEDGVRRGRIDFLAQFPSLNTPEVVSRLLDPCDEATFLRCRLDHTQRGPENPIYLLHRDLLALRRTDAVLSLHDARHLHAASLGPAVLLLRLLPPSGDTRLLVFNFGPELVVPSVYTPLAAPPVGRRWSLLWSSEDPRYGRAATPTLETDEGWRIAAESALVLEPVVKGD